MAMVLALVILITSINIDSYVLDASEQTRAETMDVTGDEEHLKLMYTEWWYDSADDIQSDIYSDTHSIEEQNNTIDMSEYTTGEAEYTSKKAGLFLEYSAYDVISGDTFEVTFPETLTDVKVDDENISGDVDYSLDVVNTDNERGTRLTVTFSGDGDHHGVIPVVFHFAATDEVTLTLQRFPNNTIEYKLIPPLQEQRSVVMSEADRSEDDTTEKNDFDPEASSEISSEDTQIDTQGDIESYDVAKQDGDGESRVDTGFTENHFSIKANLLFNDKTPDGTDWRSLIRPLEFDQKIVLEAEYKDSEGNVYTQKIYAQDDQPKDNFYLMITHDGEGGGSIEISDVPNYITVDGKNYPVTKYKVNVESELPYYESNGFDVDIDASGQTTAVISTLEVHVKSRKLNIASEIIGDDTAHTFDVNAVYTNGQADVNTKTKTLTQTYKVSSEKSSEVYVPVGLGYEVRQTAADGYKLSPDYKIKIKKDGIDDPETSSKQAPVSGTVAADEDVTITSVNYSQNRTFSFNVSWIDNNNTNRPEPTSENFELQYKTADGVWTTITEESLETLGILKLPVFNATKSADGEYSYTGLPGVDADGKELEYRIQPADVPAKYAVSVYDAGKIVTYREITDFNATISWLDNGNKPDKRPEADKLADALKLYRRTDQGTYEEVTGADLKNSITATDGSDNWTVKVKNLPRYNDDNQEYDYVLVQGSIEQDNTIKQTVLENYKTYYNNVTGNYGNDTQLCHDNGKITERIYAFQDFLVTKEWKDTEEDKKSRPEATVTLWRYSVADPSEDLGIDKMYESGKAAKVIYRKPETSDNGTVTYSDVLLSYKLDNTKDKETIVFDHSTVDGMSEGLKLPAYDEQGHSYVYFVRETLADESYETAYSQDREQGAASGGTITNTRREKAAVNVTKQWKCPSDLTNIDGTSIQFVIKAPLKGDDTSTLHELAVYSPETGSYDILSGDDKDKELTISGFSSSVTSLSSIAYVNIYDEDGKPYDMTKAVIEEVYVKKAGSGDTEDSISVSDNSYTLNGSTYNVDSKYVSDGKINGEMKLYSYTVSNTITGTRDYTLTKDWGSGITDEERNNVKCVNFSLTRQSTKDGSKPEPVVGEYHVDPVDKKKTWSNVIKGLEKYDPDGYAYHYQATELSVKLKDDTTKTPSEMGWSVGYTRALDGTRAVNYKYTGGSKYLRVYKNWNDNGDVAARKPVNVRIYRKSDLNVALDNIADKSGFISLDKLDSKHADYTDVLTSSNNWYCQLSLKNIEEKMGNSGYDDTKSSYSDYIVLEYSVGTEGDGAVAAVYPYDGLLQMVGSDNVTLLNGYTCNSLRQYDITVGRSGGNGDIFTITNTRTGKVTLNINKKWYDENNKDGIRPVSIRFQVCRNGEKYIPGDSSSATVPSDGTAGKETAEWDPKTGVVTLKGDSTDSDWNCSIENLPLFSDSGTTYTYSVVEIDAPTNYLSEQLATTTEKTSIPDDIVYTFGFKNTASATTTHYALKYWHDSATGGEDRPDLYMVLYRYLRSDQKTYSDTAIEELGSYEQFNGYKDQNWEKGKGSSAGGYDWKIEVTDLPKYDDQGHEYVYMFKERMNNDGTNVYGTYNSSSKTVDDHEEFTNTITDEMTVSGDKAWLGLSGYKVSEDDLPTPTIQLYRSLDDISLLNKSESEIADLVKAGKITLVNETMMDKNKYKFAFPDVSRMAAEDIKNAVDKGFIIYNATNSSYTLPKFDDNGNRYVYVVYEKLDGTAGLLYTKVSAKGTLNNTFRSDVNRRTIRVQKRWEGRATLTDAEKQYPSVTYNLYRYIKNKGVETAQLYDSVKISAASFADSKTGEYSYDFKDLLVYSPSGEEYGYYVTENGIKGYKISYLDEEGIASGYADNDRADVISVPKNALTAGMQRVTTIGTTNSYSDAGNITIFGSKYWDDYGNSDKIYGNRPDSIKVNLYRYTQHESGQINKVNPEEITISVKKQIDNTATSPYIVWTVSATDPNRWNYTIYNLEQYAPNGMPYVYSVVEEADAATGYNHSRKTVEATASSNKVQMKEIVNSFDGKYYVRKNWMDGNNKYGLRPSSVTIVLQRRIGDTGEWQNIAWDNTIGSYNESTKKWTGLPSVTKGTVNGTETDIVSVKLTADNVINNTRGNSWAYTFTNLPEYDSKGNKWEYRCIETMVGSVEVTETTSGNNEESYTAGAYTRTYTEQSASQTVVRNRLKSTSLLVTKEWIGDDEDQYHTRPDSLSFVLQMRGIKPDSESSNAENGDDTEKAESGGEPDESDGDGQLMDWQDVILADGSPYTFTIGKKDNWTKFLEDLPVATVGADGKTYYNLYFRAKEVHADGDGDGNLAKGALNYRDTTSYALESGDHKYNVDASRNESTIKNELISDDKYSSISVTKKWNRRSGESVTAEIELLYKRSGDSTWHCMGDSYGCTSGDTDGCRTSHDTADGCVVKKLISDKTKTESFTWDNLPKYDRNGKELEYKVVEHDIAGYTTDIQPKKKDDKATYDTEYVFTNTELQNYTVKKVWKNTEYAERDKNNRFSATFKLQRRLATATDVAWEDVVTTAEGKADSYVITLTSDTAYSTASYTWKDLPEYTVDGREIVYRAVETRINNVAVDTASNSNGAYIVTYQYGSDEGSVVDKVPEFTNTVTVATNRMVYGFVNMSKSAAYLTSGTVSVSPTNKKLENVTFDIYPVISGIYKSKEPYIKGVHTDSNGNLVCNDDGTYGTGADSKYLISGTYKIVETGTNPGYSVWNDGVVFTIGIGDGTTGEHGTAWIYTANELTKLSLKVNYVRQTDTDKEHDLGDSCRPLTNTGEAYNLESRGVIDFTKTGPDGNALCVHDKSAGESKAYFGVYLDENCTKQVAGMMADAGGTSMVLSIMDSDGVSDMSETLLAVKNGEGIPYLRRDSNGVLTLLSGTYYIKELVAPAGYKLDTVVRKAVVPKIEKTTIDSPLNDVYTSNKAEIMLASEAKGVSNYKWTNDENKVVIYKRDQYGRIVQLKDNGYLELKTVGSVAFLTGENTIRLYQDDQTPARNSEGKEFTDGKKPDITYNAKDGYWTISGLFDAGKTYTLTEPKASVPDSNIIAKDFVFTMNADGTISVSESDKNSKQITGNSDPLDVRGDDHQNYYKSDSTQNIVVMRDVSRYLADVKLNKIDSKSNQPIRNISFKLYRYEGLDENKQPIKPTPVLADDVYLTTDEKGMIDIESSKDGVKNLLTKYDLKYGIELGKYYFKEVERGASDRYRLADNIYFEVKAKDPVGETPEYKDYAEVVFETNSFVTQENDSIVGVVSNTPVTEKSKTLVLTKVDSGFKATTLANARFTLTYTSVNKTEGHHEPTVENCVTDSNGVLYLANENWIITSDASKNQPDISLKGHYVLKEVLAPEKYMTRTDDKGVQVTMLEFDVNSDNNIVNVKTYLGSGDLIETSIEKDASGEIVSLGVTVKNEKTAVSVGKRNDIENSTKTANQTSVNGEMLSGAKLAIYEGVYDEQTSGTSKSIDLWTTNEQVHDIPAGTLKENTIYTLHEEKAPVGYLAARDIYFKIFGTTTRDGQIISQIYVWTGSGIPDSDKVTESAGWSALTSLNDKVLTMVDEAVIAPVDAQKVVGNVDNYAILPGAKFDVFANDKDSSDNVKLGTAVSNEDGYLVWDTIADAAYGEKLIYNKDGRRVASADSETVISKTIILQQNKYGYTFTEVSSPDNAYNEGKSFKVNITADNYEAYRTGAGKYNTDKYIDIVKADNAKDNIVSDLSVRDNKDKNATNSDLVNPPYKARIKLHKYDADEEAGKVGINKTKFTLYKASVVGETWTQGEVVNDAAYYVAENNMPQNITGVFETDENGNLTIEIHNKGYYILRETNPATGYKLDDSNASEFRFQLVDKATPKQNDKGIYGYNTENQLSVDDTGIPNTRIMGSVSLTKTDKGTKESLDGVEYELTRTDLREDQSSFLLSSPVTVVTGKKYTAKKDKDETGTEKWQLIESAGTSGNIEIEGLNWGTYTLQEKQELSGYVKSDKKYTFEIKPEALDVTISDEGQKGVTNAKNKVVLHKVGNTEVEGKNLKGAVFEVHEEFAESCSNDEKAIEVCTKAKFYASEDSNKKVTEVVSGPDGTVTIYGLPTDNNTLKRYHLVETTAPKGYKISKPVDFTIDRYGNVTYGDGSTSTLEEVKMTDEPIKLYVQKIGEEKEKLLSGAEFQLTDVCDSGCDHKFADEKTNKITIKTDADGKVMIPLETVIAGHTYQLIETKAPDGYECTAVVTFKVDRDGKASIENATGGYVKNDPQNADASITTAELDASNTIFTISNERIGISLVKEDYDAPDKKLDGVTFTLEPAEGSSFVNEYKNKNPNKFSGNIFTIGSTDANGDLTIPLELLKHDNSYILTETAIGNNQTYRFAEDAKDRQITINVEKDGTLTIVNPGEMFSLDANDNTKVIVKNQQIDLTITKKDQATGNPLSGVTLKLSKLGENNKWSPVLQSGVKTNGTWTTGEDGTVTFKGAGFTAGTYKLEEITTPDGYNPIAGSLVFVINNAGRVTKTAVASDDQYTLSDIDKSGWTDKNFKITNPADGKPGHIQLYVSNAKFTDLKITKQGSDGKSLQGADFILEYKDSNDNWQKLKLNNGKAELINRIPVTGDEDSAKLTTDQYGIVTFGNLPDGMYRLTETKTVKGYNLLSAPIEINIDRNGMVYTATTTGDNKTTTLSMEDGTDTLLMTVINKKGNVLPKTGKQTPNLPKAVLPVVAMVEALMLYLYGSRGRRRRKKGVNGHDR